MSSIGMIESLAEFDEYCLVTVSGGRGGEILDCDGETVTRVDEKYLVEAAKCFPLIVRLYQKGLTNGERTGRHRQQHDTLKALGIEGLDYRVCKLECDVFPGECMA